MAARARDRYLKGRLEIGTRWTRFTLLKSHQGEPFHGSFVGSITELREEQDQWPNKLFVQYGLSPYVWAGLSYDHLRARAWDSGGGDGSIDMQGVMPYVAARWANRTRWTPYAEAGLVYYRTSFDSDPNWANNGQREFALDNTCGYALALGCDCALTRNWSAGLYGRYTYAKVNGSFFDFGQDLQDFTFPVSHWTYGVGAKHAF